MREQNQPESSAARGESAAWLRESGFGVTPLESLCAHRARGRSHPEMTKGSLLVRTETRMKHPLNFLRFLWLLSFSSFFFLMYFFFLVGFCFLPKNKTVTSHADLVCAGQGLF